MTQSESPASSDSPRGDPERVLEASPERVREAVVRARVAQPEWAELDQRERSRRIIRVRRRLLADAENIASLVHRELGRPFEDVLFGEILPSAELIEALALDVEERVVEASVVLDRLPHSRRSGQAFRAPVGVVAVISGSSEPVAQPLRALVMALLVGNSVVLKPSPRATESVAAVVALFAGIVPTSVIEVMQGGASTGASLVGAGVDCVLFGGVSSTAKLVAKACGDELLPYSVEVERRGAALVLADAPLERAARGIVWAAFASSGASPIGVDRVYVVDAVAKSFTDRVVALTRELRLGVDVESHPNDGDAKSLVARAIEAGAEALVERGELFVLRVVDEEIDLLREAPRGLVLSIITVKSAAEGVARMNASRSPAVSLWTDDLVVGRELARVLRHQFVALNDVGPAFSDASTITSGSSSFGPHALSVLTRERLIVEDDSRAKSEPVWYPYTEGLRDLGLTLARARGGASLLRRVIAIARLFVLIPKRLFAKLK